MPIFDTTTKAAKSVWKSPDGQREIFEVILDYEGQDVKVQTFSEAIATVGFQGKVETYEKESKGGRPPQSFVKQPPKEGGYSGGSTQSGTSSGSRSSSGYVPKDEKAIQAMWAIGQAVQYVGQWEKQPKPEVIEQFAADFFSMVARVKASEEAPDVAKPETPTDKPTEPTLEPSVQELNEVLGGELLSPEEGTPWNKPTKS